MKIGVLSDIHGNIYALEKVLKEAKVLNVEGLFILGDMIGYYYHPKKVLEMLDEWTCLMIKGNHEEMLDRSEQVEEITRYYGSGFKMALEQLDQEQIEFLKMLPTRLDVTREGIQLLLAHGSPWNNNRYIYPDAPSAILDRCTEVDADCVLLGHTHHSFVYSNNGTQVINVGSVGQNRVKGGQAEWAVIDTCNRCVQIRSTKYDINNLLQEVRETDPGLKRLEEFLVR
jgi:putative phosphoesterase